MKGVLPRLARRALHHQFAFDFSDLLITAVIIFAGGPTFPLSFAFFGNWLYLPCPLPGLGQSFFLPLTVPHSPSTPPSPIWVEVFNPVYAYN